MADRLAAQKSHPLDAVDGGDDLDLLDRKAVVSDASVYEAHVRGLRTVAAACVNAPVARREYLAARQTALARVRGQVHWSAQKWSTAAVVSHRARQVEAVSRASKEAGVLRYSQYNGQAAGGASGSPNRSPAGCARQPHCLPTSLPAGPTALESPLAGGQAIPAGAAATPGGVAAQGPPSPQPPSPASAIHAPPDRPPTPLHAAVEDLDTPSASAPADAPHPGPPRTAPVGAQLPPAPAQPPQVTAGSSKRAANSELIPLGPTSLAPPATPAESAPPLSGRQGSARQSFFTPGRRALPRPSSAPRSTPKSRGQVEREIERIKVTLKRQRAALRAADAKKRVRRLTVKVCSRRH